MPGEGKHSKEWDNMFKSLCDEGMSEEMAAKMATEKVGFSDNPETFDLADVEIFAAGKWKGEDYTEQDLDNIVHNFDLLGKKYKAPLKLGHASDQKLLQSDGYPAAGWVSNLKRSGTKLVATFTNVPKKIKQLIDRKAYGRFSSEILWNFSFGGNVHKRVLRAVALLGADMPAVTSINDILGLYTGEDIFQGELHAYHDLEEKKGVKMPTVEELQTQLNEKDAKLAKLSQDIQTKDEALQNLEKENLERFAADFKVKVYSTIDEGIKAGKILPIQREYLAAIALTKFDGAEQVHKFADGEIKSADSLTVLGEMIAKTPVNSMFAEKTTKGKEQEKEVKEEKQEEGGRIYSTGAELDEKVKAIQKEKSCTYSEAYNEAIKEVK
jgi:hypothetical protein